MARDIFYEQLSSLSEEVAAKREEKESKQESGVFIDIFRSS